MIVTASLYFLYPQPIERCSPEEIAVRAKPHESKLVGGHLHVDQQEVGPDVALAAIAPVPGQVMISVAHRQRPVARQHLQNRVEEVINVCSGDLT